MGNSKGIVKRLKLWIIDAAKYLYINIKYRMGECEWEDIKRNVGKYIYNPKIKKRLLPNK